MCFLVDFQLTEEVKVAIKYAHEKYENKTNSLDLNWAKFEGWGKHYIKQQKLSPDSFMQLAIQVCLRGLINNFQMHSLPWKW